MDVALLGRIFVQTRLNGPPDILRVVGWTKKRFIVENVPSVVHIGNWGAQIDMKWVSEHPIQAPQTKGGIQASVGDGATLKLDGERYYQVTAENAKTTVYKYCEY